MRSSPVQVNVGGCKVQIESPSKFPMGSHAPVLVIRKAGKVLFYSALDGSTFQWIKRNVRGS